MAPGFLVYDRILVVCFIWYNQENYGGALIGGNSEATKIPWHLSVISSILPGSSLLKCASLQHLGNANSEI